MNNQGKSMKTVIGKITSVIISVAMLTSSFANVVYATGNETTPKNIIQKEIYVSTKGNDQNGDGTAQSPFATVDKARQEVAKINSNMTGDIIVNIKEGNYYLNDTLLFNETDSGSNGFNVIYKSADGIGKAHLNGGDKLSSEWALADESDVALDLDSSMVGKVYKTQLDPSKYDFNTMYVNENRATMARTKNRTQDERFPSQLGQYMVATGGMGKNGLYYKSGDLTANEIAGLQNAVTRGDMNAQILVWSWDYRDWFTDTCYIDKINPANNGIYFKTKADDKVWNTAKYGIGGGARFFLQGNLSFLDVQGEYYYNNSTGMLYYYPKDGEDINTAEVVIPTLDEVIKLKGADKADWKDEPILENQVHNIVFSGVTIEKTDFPGYFSSGWDYGPWGYPEASKGSTNPTFCAQTERVEYQYGAVTMNGTHNITIENSRFNNLGFYGTVMYMDNDSNTIINSEYSNLGYGAIAMDGGYPGVGKYNNHHVVKNVMIHDIGQLVGHSSGITVLSSGYNTFSNIEIYNSPRRALFMSSWQRQTVADEDYDDYNDIYTKYNKFEYINIHDCEQDGGDDGAIFTFCMFTDKNRFHPNYLENIVVDRVGANPSMKDFSPNGMNLDCSAVGVHVKNVKIVNPQHYNFRFSASDDSGATWENCNLAYYGGAREFKTFDESKMEYDKIGIVAGFPEEFAHKTQPAKTYSDMYYRDEFDGGLNDWWKLSGKPETSPVYFSDSEDFVGNSFLADPFYNKSANGCAIGKPFGTDLNKVVEIDFFDYVSGAKNNGYCGQPYFTNMNSFARVDNGNQVKAIGVNSAINNEYFSYKVGSLTKVTDIKREYGWHTFKWDYTSGNDVKMYIDDKIIATVPSSSFNYIEMGEYGSKSMNAYDNVVIYGGKTADAPIKLPDDIITVDEDTTIYIPGTIEAEKAVGAGLTIADCNDGGKMLSNLTVGNEASYEAYAPKASDYTLDLRYAATEDSVVEITVNNNAPTTANLTATGGATTWSNVYSVNPIVAGKNTIKIKVISGTLNLNYIKANIFDDAPGKIEAESGVFTGSTLPKPDVGDGGTIMGFVAPGQTFTYNVNVKKAGEYSLKYRASQGYKTPKVTCYVNGEMASELVLNGAVDWSVFNTYDAGLISLKEGENEIKLVMGGPHAWVWNFNWLSITSGNPSSPSDITALENKIMEAEALLSQYLGGGESYKTFNAVVKSALGVYKSPWSQEEVDATIADLDVAMAKFKQASEDNSTATAKEVADKLTIKTPILSDTSIEILGLPEFYKMKIKETSNLKLINKKGDLVFPDVETTVDVTVEVTRLSDNSTATAIIPVVLPVLTAQEVADRITLESPAKGAKYIDMPVVPFGFDVYVRTSTNNMIAPDGKIATVIGDQDVDVTFTVSKTATGTSADKTIRIRLINTAKPLGVAIEANEIDALYGPYIKVQDNEVFNFNGGTWFRYDNVNFGETPKDIKLHINLAVHPDWEGKKIHVMLDDVDNGTNLGTVTVSAGGATDWGQYHIQELELSQKLSGIHTIYMLGDGGEGVAGVKEIMFEDVTPIAPVDPANKTDLEALVSYAKAQKELDEYKFVVPAVKSALDARIVSAEAIIADVNATQANVDLAYSSLLDVVQMLSYTGDNTTLLEKYNVWKEFNPAMYTQESAKAMTDALAIVKPVIDNPNALQDEIDTALATLETAIEGMELYTANKDALRAQIEKANKYNDNLNNYIDNAGKTEFIAALAAANDVVAQDYPTQEAIDAACTRLMKATWGLREIPNKDKLQELINQANALDVTGYTASSVKARAEAISYAQTVMADPMATQEDVNAAITGIKTTTANLVLVEDEKTDDKETTDTTKDETTDKTEDTKVPTTSDTTPLAVVFALAMVSCACVVVRKKVTK